MKNEKPLIIAGVDEVGRGPLIGSVVAAACILPSNFEIKGLNDSKKISEKKRLSLDIDIREHALAWSIAEASPAEIDQINILQATFLAMTRAVKALSMQPDLVLVDGNRLPKWNYQAKAIVGGDGFEECISAASIIAKVYRDKQMQELGRKFPQYGFEKHKGYPTKQHLEAISKYGVLPSHRRSFGPVRKVLGI